MYLYIVNKTTAIKTTTMTTVTYNTQTNNAGTETMITEIIVDCLGRFSSWGNSFFQFYGDYKNEKAAKAEVDKVINDVNCSIDNIRIAHSYFHAGLNKCIW